MSGLISFAHQIIIWCNQHAKTNKQNSRKLYGTPADPHDCISRSSLLIFQEKNSFYDENLIQFQVKCQVV